MVIELTGNINYQQTTLKTIVNDNAEWKRLCELVKSEHNLYNAETEVYMLICLNKILLTGYFSYNITSVQQIEYLFKIINN